jgi:hypothetical protein
MAKIAVIARARAAKAEPFDAPKMLTARPIHKSEITATRSPWTNACKARSRQDALNRLVPKMVAYTGVYVINDPTAAIAAA